MPYTYKKVGDQYCVFKKNGGKKVGCTDGTKQALNKYLAALHANVDEQTSMSIFKTIRDYINEDDQVLKTNKPIGLKSFASNKAAADAIVGAGLEDGDKQDDVIPGEAATIAVKDLRPAQTEIIKEKAFGIAIGMLEQGKWEGLDLGSIVSNDNYIMDGHHRWAAVSLIDPKASLRVTAIDLPGGPLVSTLNAATAGKLGITTGNKGKGNVQEFTGDKMSAVIDNAMVSGVEGEFPKTPEQVKQALGKVPGANGDPEKGKQIMLKNADALPKKIMPGAPPRVDMPVISPEKVNTIQKMIAKGALDIKPPFSATVDKLTPLKESDILSKQLTYCQQWLRDGKHLKEIKFTSYGIPELLQLVYDNPTVLQKLGYRDFKHFLEWVKNEWDQEEHKDAVMKIRALNIPGAQQLVFEIKQQMKKQYKQKLEEELARRLVRKQINEAYSDELVNRLLKEAEETEDSEEAKKPDAEKVQDEPGLDPELSEITDLYIKKLKNAQAAVDQSDVVEIIAQLLDSFGYGNQDKLTVLQGAKQLSVR